MWAASARMRTNPPPGKLPTRCGDLCFDALNEVSYYAIPTMNPVRAFAIVSLLAAFLAGPREAAAQGVSGRGRAIQFSDPKVEVVTSNLNQAATAKKPSLRTLDDQFKAPFNVLDSGDPAGAAGMPMPLLRTPTLNPRAVQDLKQKRKEREQWIFGSPEDLEAQRVSAEQMFGITEYEDDGTEKKNKTPLQRYWDREERERLGQTNRFGADYSGEKTDQEIKDQAKLIFGTLNLPAEGAAESPNVTVKTALTPTYSPSVFQEMSPLRGASDLFSRSTPALLPQKSEAMVRRANEFKQLFDTKPAAPSVSSFASPPSAGFGRSSSVTDFGSSTTWRSGSSVAPVSSYNSLQGSSLTKPLGGGYPASTLNTPPPATQTPKFTTQPGGFQVPKRAF